MHFKPLLALAVTISSVAVAQVPAPESTPTPAPKKADKERMICRPIANSASRMAQKTCHTAAEWSALSKGDNNIDTVRRQ